MHTDFRHLFQPCSLTKDATTPTLVVQDQGSWICVPEDRVSQLSRGQYPNEMLLPRWWSFRRAQRTCWLNSFHNWFKLLCWTIAQLHLHCHPIWIDLWMKGGDRSLPAVAARLWRLQLSTPLTLLWTWTTKKQVKHLKILLLLEKSGGTKLPTFRMAKLCYPLLTLKLQYLTKQNDNKYIYLDPHGVTRMTL